MVIEMLESNKIRGCYWGIALGDALGKPVEFNDIYRIKDIYGTNGIQNLKNYSIWTDDTEMTFAVSKALLRLGNINEIKTLNENNIGKTFAEEFIKWLENPGHAPGNTCRASIFSLKNKGPDNWRDVGKNDSKGCGTAMRAAPLGIWVADPINQELSAGEGEIHDLLRTISQIQSEITHGHKAATAAALAASYSVTLSINGFQPIEMIEPIQKYCKNIHPDFDDSVNRILIALERIENGQFENDIEALHFIGKGWVGEEAFSMALYSAIRYPSNFLECLRTAVNHSGDSDSVGCIAGSIVGTYNGIESIPNDWIERLAEKDRMHKLLNDITQFFET